MRFVKKIIVASGLVVTAFLAIGHGTANIPTAPVPAIPARADLAESVLAMIVARADEAGLPQPVTLCEACAAAHLDLPAETVRNRCRRACGLE